MRVAPRRPAGVPAKFAPDPQRRGMIAKVKIAAKELAFEDDDYRALLERITGKRSAADLSIRQLEEVLAEFRRVGWTPALQGGRAAVTARAASHPSAKKARALWLSLGLLGVIRDASEAGLEAFARRQLGVERLQWADQALVYKLIEAIKAIAERHGWEQSTAGLDAPIWTLKLRLCEAIAKRLVSAGGQPDLPLAVHAERELGTGAARVLELTEAQLEQLSAALGRRLAHAVADDHYA